MSNIVNSLTEEELEKVSGGASIDASLTEITIVLDAGEDAADAVKKLSLPLGLKLDAESIALLNEKVVPSMGSTGPRTLYAKYTIKYPYVHVTEYSIT